MKNIKFYFHFIKVYNNKKSYYVEYIYEHNIHNTFTAQLLLHAQHMYVCRYVCLKYIQYTACTSTYYAS